MKVFKNKLSNRILFKNAIESKVFLLSIANPVNYLGANLTWQGRDLTSYENEDNKFEYLYDENGMRYRTTITNKEDNSKGYLDYVWVDSKLVSISFTSDELNQTVKYLYDDSGSPVGFIATREDGSVDTFYYLKNAQGDITNIVSAAGKKMVSFTYDAFGKRTVEYQANNSTTPGQIELLTQMKADLLNPFAYRGYCYDYDMGMYYLQSRYYDPEVGRFINSDSTDYLNATGTVLGCNLFAYCENDPVNFTDAMGTWKKDVHAGYYKTMQFSTNNATSIKTKKFTNKKYLYGKIKKIYIPYYVVDDDFDKFFYGTFYWAIQAGFKAEHAQKIAYWCNYIDELKSPLKFYDLDTQGWHFDVYEDERDSRKIKSNEMRSKASKYFKKALRQKEKGKDYSESVQKGLKYLGYALHPLQDIYAHTSDMVYTVPYTIDTVFTTPSGYSYISKEYHYFYSHVGNPADNVQMRISQAELTHNKTKAILKKYYNTYSVVLK